MAPRRPAAAAALLALLVGLPWGAAGQATLQLDEPTVVRALAVAETSQGFTGSVSTISISAARGGSGHVFLDTSPLAQVDMQGSARLAVRVAAAVTGLSMQERDFFFVVRSDASVVGGPSAGGVMTVGAIAALMGWRVNQSVMMTGTVNPDGDIGPIGGLLEKIEAAARAGATLFLFPEAQANATRLGAGARSPALHVPAFCASVGLRCEAVATVEDAVRHMTGRVFAPRPPPGEVTSPDFQAAMRPLASNLTAQARALVEASAARHARLSASLAPQVRDDLARELEGARRVLVQADQAYAEGRYYTASSRSYQASLAGRSVDHVLGLFEATDRDAYVRGLLDDAAQRAARAARDAQGPVLGASHLEGLGAAQERASEAERAAQQARAAWQRGDVSAALQSSAQARERSASVAWWLDLSLRAPGGAPVSAPALERTARDLLGTAREAVVYAEVLLPQAGGSARLLAAAKDLLQRAEGDAARGFLPAAIFEALQAEVRASAALELAGLQAADAKLQRARDRAAAAILEARASGPEPLLAQSYFEFAGDLADPEDALAFYNTARSVARLHATFFREGEAEARASRFVGFDPLPQAPRQGFLEAAGGAVALLAVLLVGLVLGTALAFTGLVAAKPRAPPAPPPPLYVAPPDALALHPAAQPPPASPPSAPPPGPGAEGAAWGPEGEKEDGRGPG